MLKKIFKIGITSFAYIGTSQYRELFKLYITLMKGFDISMILYSEKSENCENLTTAKPSFYLLFFFKFLQKGRCGTFVTKDLLDWLSQYI